MKAMSMVSCVLIGAVGCADVEPGEIDVDYCTEQDGLVHCTFVLEVYEEVTTEAEGDGALGSIGVSRSDYLTERPGLDDGLLEPLPEARLSGPRLPEPFTPNFRAYEDSSDKPICPRRFTYIDGVDRCLADIVSLKELDERAFDCIYELCPDQQWSDHGTDVESSGLVALDEYEMSASDFLDD